MKESKMIYKGFCVYYDPPPIPVRIFDWHWVHKDYDPPGDDRFCHTPSQAEALIAIDNFIREKKEESE